MAAIFDPKQLQAIVQMHMHLPIAQQFDAVSQTLVDVYGEHVHPGQEWIWSNAGGIMCAISVLHVSFKEYLLFCGTAIGSEGHSGRHRTDLYDVVMGGELSTYQPGHYERTTYRPGDLAYLKPGTTNGSKLSPGCWLLEYAYGNVPSMFPFALGDSLFSTLDLTDLTAQLGIANRLMLKEARSALREWRSGGRPAPNLAAIQPPQKVPTKTRSKRNGSKAVS